jgi:superfamily II DNA or RNA helicase
MTSNQNAAVRGKVLYPYQRAIVKSTVDHLRRHPAAQVQMATGTGKTLVEQRVAEALVGRRADALVVVMFPNLTLLGQTIAAWRSDTVWRDEDGRPAYREIAVCSQADAPMSDAELAQAEQDGLADVLLDTATTLQAAGIDPRELPVTTDPQTIAALLNDRSGRMVAFCTYQSADKLAAAIALVRAAQEDRASSRKLRIDVLVADEAHRTVGPVTTVGGGGTFGLVTNRRALPARARLFATATPRNGGPSSARWGSAMQYMDNEALYGKVTGTYTLRQAIEDGYLCDYQVCLVGVDQREIGRVLGHDVDTVPVDLTGTGLEDPHGSKVSLTTAAIAVAKLIAQHRRCRVMVFHNRIAASRRFVDILVNQVIPLMPQMRGRAGIAIHVDAQTPVEERAAVLDTLRSTDPAANQWTVVSNVGVFAEGVDVPELDAVVFAAPRWSIVDIIQIVGRALRIDHARLDGYHRPAAVMMGVLVRDGGDDPAAHMLAMDESAFSVTGAVLHALRVADTAIGERAPSAGAAASRRRRFRVRQRPDGSVAVTLGGDAPVQVNVAPTALGPTWPGASVLTVVPQPAGPEPLVPASSPVASVDPQAAPVGPALADPQPGEPAPVPDDEPDEPWMVIDLPDARPSIFDPDSGIVPRPRASVEPQTGQVPQPRPRPARPADRRPRFVPDLPDRVGSWDLVDAGADDPALTYPQVEGEALLRVHAIVRAVAVPVLEAVYEEWNKIANRVAEDYWNTLVWPRPDDPDPTAARNGRWLERQRKSARDGRLGLQDRAFLERLLPGWEKSPTPEQMLTQMARQVEAVADWRDEHPGLRPSPGSADRTERQVAQMVRTWQFLAASRNPRRQQMLPDKVRTFMDMVLPEWNSTWMTSGRRAG